MANEWDDRDSREPEPRSRGDLQPHRGQTIMVLGILSFFVLQIVLGPMAWIMGNNDLREMDAGRMDPSGRDNTNTGRICGMISTIITGVSLGLILILFLCCMGGTVFTGVSQPK